MKREALLAALDEELRFQMGGAPGAWIEPLTHAFAAIEARGLAVVPVVATEGRREALWEYMDLGPHYDQEAGLEDRRDYTGGCWTAMLSASKDDPAHD